MTISTTGAVGYLEIRIDGELTIRNRTALKERVTRAIEEGVRGVILNFREAQYVDTIALGAIVGMTRRARARGVDVIIQHPGEEFRALLELTQLDSVLTVHS